MLCTNKAPHSNLQVQIITYIVWSSSPKLHVFVTTGLYTFCDSDSWAEVAPRHFCGDLHQQSGMTQTSHQGSSLVVKVVSSAMSLRPNSSPHSEGVCGFLLGSQRAKQQNLLISYLAILKHRLVVWPPSSRVRRQDNEPKLILIPKPAAHSPVQWCFEHRLGAEWSSL